MGKYFTPEEVANIWRIKLPTIWRWIRDGGLAVTTVGRSYRIHEDVVRKGVPRKSG
jgi:excisionase family DNA binding protein